MLLSKGKDDRIGHNKIRLVLVNPKEIIYREIVIVMIYDELLLYHDDIVLKVDMLLRFNQHCYDQICIHSFIHIEISS